MGKEEMFQKTEQNQDTEWSDYEDPIDFGFQRNKDGKVEIVSFKPVEGVELPIGIFTQYEEYSDKEALNGYYKALEKIRAEVSEMDDLPEGADYIYQQLIYAPFDKTTVKDIMADVEITPEQEAKWTPEQKAKWGAIKEQAAHLKYE